MWYMKKQTSKKETNEIKLAVHVGNGKLTPKTRAWLRSKYPGAEIVNLKAGTPNADISHRGQ